MFKLETPKTKALEKVCVMEDQLINNVKKLHAVGEIMARSMKDIMPANGKKHWRELRVEQGRALLCLIDYREGYAAISDNISQAKTTFPVHSHEGTEIFYVYKGVMELKLGERSQIVKIGEGHKKHFIFDATEPHGAYFPVDCGYYAITDPPEESWLK